MTRPTPNRGENKCPRRAYARPVLREFGPVGSLTQGGTGARQEMANSMSPVHRA